MNGGERDCSEILTDSFLPIVLLCERDRARLLKKESFLEADEGGEPEDSLPPGKLSMLEVGLMILEFCPVRKIKQHSLSTRPSRSHQIHWV